MMAATVDRERPFGRVVTAMITPFAADGALDLTGAARLATHLVDDGGCDGVLVSGTTGEAPTTSDAEKDALLRAVRDAVGDRATVLAGVGTNDTAHSVELARAAAAAGADGLLVVSPYYSKPPQSGIERHVRTVADATELPVMLYDIPGRSAVPFTTETLVRLAEHPRVRAVKDAKGDLAASSWVMARTDLAYYSGEDMLNLPLAAVGGVGVVSVTAHLVGARIATMLDAHDKGDVTEALRIHRSLLPVTTGIFRNQGVIMVKAALDLLGLPAGPVRSPLVDADAGQRETLRADLSAGGIEL